MKNRLTFANVINILIENKKKTYPQHKLICDLFSVYLGSRNADDTIYSEDNTMFSRWCTGARPIPMEILRTYEDDENFDVMEDGKKEPQKIYQYHLYVLFRQSEAEHHTNGLCR